MNAKTIYLYNFEPRGGGPDGPPPRAGVRVEPKKFDPGPVEGRVSSPELGPKVGLCGSLIVR